MLLLKQVEVHYYHVQNILTNIVGYWVIQNHTNLNE